MFISVKWVWGPWPWIKDIFWLIVVHTHTLHSTPVAQNWVHCPDQTKIFKMPSLLINASLWLFKLLTIGPIINHRQLCTSGCIASYSLIFYFHSITYWRKTIKEYLPCQLSTQEIIFSFFLTFWCNQLSVYNTFNHNYYLSLTLHTDTKNAW